MCLESTGVTDEEELGPSLPQLMFATCLSQNSYIVGGHLGSEMKAGQTLQHSLSTVFCIGPIGRGLSWKNMKTLSKAPAYGRDWRQNFSHSGTLQTIVWSRVSHFLIFLHIESLSAEQYIKNYVVSPLPFMYYRVRVL